MITTSRFLEHAPVSRWTRSTKILAGLAVALVCCTPWLMVNLTSSAPRGVWSKTALPSVITRGMWVTLPVPATVEPFVPWWIPLLKPVAAVAGDCVCVEEGMLSVRPEGLATLEGIETYGRVYTQAQGRPLPHLPEGCLQVPAGAVFLASRLPQSLDSRYFGPVPVSALMAQAKPVWTWR